MNEGLTDNFVLHYDQIEKKPAIPSSSQTIPPAQEPSFIGRKKLLFMLRAQYHCLTHRTILGASLV
uniref:Uncharacterized protein n=1 Tax=Oryza barthii TaxID=65489 RepID=A0A0D3FNR6_9ORYZ